MSDGKIVIETGLDNSGIEAGIEKMKSVLSTGAKVAVAGINVVSTAFTKVGEVYAAVGKEFETSMAKASTLFGNVQADVEKSFQDLIAEGVLLNETMDLMGDYAEKNNKSLSDMFSNIEAGKTTLSVSGQNAEQYTENLAAMSTEAEVVGDAYEKMSDALEIKTNQVKESVENLEAQFYESIERPLKEAVELGIDCIDQLADAFENGGLEGAVEAVGDIFTDLVEMVAEAAPDMINAAVSLIKAFINGLIKNRASLGKAALDIAVALANGLIQFLPSKMQKPAKDAINAITTSLTSGGLKNGVDTIIRLFESIGDAIIAVTNTILPPFVSAIDFVGDHLTELAAIVAIGGAAFEGYKIIQTISKFTAAYSGIVATLTAMEQANALQVFAASGALTAKEFIVGVLTGKITLATAATAAWNAVMNANPIGIVITAIAALVGGIAAYNLLSDDSAESTALLSEEQQALADSASEAAEKYTELEEARKERLSGIDAEYSNTQALADELSTIVDENGRIKEGYEERANIITGLLSQALGTEIKITDGVIQNYGKLKESIDEVIRSKKAEAVQSSMQEDYATAIKEKTKRYQEYATSQKAAAENSEALAKAEQKRQEIQDKIDNSPYADAFIKYGNELQSAEANVKLLSETQESLNKTLSDNESAYVKCATTIQNYEGITGAIVSGDAEQIDKALAMATNSFQTAETGTKATLENQISDLRQSYEAMKEAVASGAPGVTETTVDELYGLYMAAQAEYGKLTDMSEEEINGWTELSNNAFSSSNTPEVAKQKMEETIESIVNPFGVGAPKVSKAASELVDSANAGIKTSDTTSVAQSSLSKTGDTMASTLGEARPKVENAAKETMSGYTSGVQASTGDAEKAGTAVSESSVKGLESVSSTESGEKIGNQYTSGVNSKSTDSYNSGKSLASNAHRGLASVKGDGVGADFAQGYINGMNNKSSDVQQAAANLARQALNAVKNTQASASPSKKTKKLAKDFVDGYSGEMKDRAADVQKAASDLATAALKELLKANGNYEDMGKQAVERYESGMEAAVTSSENKVEKILDQEVSKAIRARKKQIKAANKALRKTITKENKKTVEAKIKENNKDLKTFKDNYKKMGKAALKAYQDALEDEAKKVQESLSDTIDKITKEYQEKYDDVISLRDSMSGKLSDTDLFEKKDDEVILTNLEDEIAAIAKYDASMSRLKGRISEDLLQEITGMSREDALAYTDALLAMSEQELSRYSALYDKKNADAKAVAQKFYQDQLDTIQTEFTGKINGAFASAQKEMESIGKNVAQGFVKGLKSQTKSLTAAVKSMSKSIIKQVKKDFGIKSPSKEFEAIAEYCTEGYEKQYTRGMGEARKTVSKAGQGILDTARKSLDYSALAARMRAGVQAVNARAGESLAATVNYKVSGAAQVEAENAGRERTKLAGEIVDAFVRAGIGVKVGNREFGRLVREVM